ncbi:MAG: metallophosphoesterase [Lachnospiraceae bacterium]|nr:metallophosphoesterase [Lachnospiraceae bacterium]
MIVFLASVKTVVAIVAMAAAVLLLTCLFLYKESKGFGVVRYSFVNGRLHTDHFRMAVISDMHDCDHGNDNEDVLKAIDRERPDAVFLAGDMVTSSMEPRYHESNAIKFISALSKKYPIYYGIGNHEEKLRRCSDRFPGAYEGFVSRLSDMGVRMLTDEKVSIEPAGIDVYGLDLEHEYYRKFRTKWIPDDYLKNKFGDIDKGRVSVLIAHNPEQFDKYALWDPDYVLAGHVHGGIVNIPLLGGMVSPQLKLFPKYDAGIFKRGDSTMILSRGLGSHTVPIRVFNKAEVIIIDLYKKQEDNNTGR